LTCYWKNNNKGDDCYGAKKYVDWVKKYSTQEPEMELYLA
jgi:hypothetical protein